MLLVAFPSGMLIGRLLGIIIFKKKKIEFSEDEKKINLILLSWFLIGSIVYFLNH
jgi:hypothetical protein